MSDDRKCGSYFFSGKFAASHNDDVYYIIVLKQRSDVKSFDTVERKNSRRCFF